MSRRYDGKLQIGPAGQGAYIDIDPPIPDGMVGMVSGITFSVASNDTANDYVEIGVSVQATGRESCDVATDGIPADMLALRYEPLVLQANTSKYLSVTTLLKDGFLFQDGYVAETPVCFDKLRLFVHTPQAVAVLASIDVAYELHIEEVKRTSDLQNLLWQKQYT
jgi:hypothetical protein